MTLFQWHAHSFMRDFGWAAFLMIAQSASADKVVIGRFSEGDLTGWQEKSFVGHTIYRITRNNEQQALKAISSGAASGLFRKVDIDLGKTPYLNWSWKIENTYTGNDERSKQGDDYPARIYVVVSGGLFFWRTRAVNYVWSSHQPMGSEWKNAYTGNAGMIALRSGDEDAGQWVAEKRNVREDLKKLFDRDFAKIDAVAIMSDSDNTGQIATAFYGDIYFSDN